MTQPFNSDLLLRMSTLNQEQHLLQTNTNIFIQTIKEQISLQQEEISKCKSTCEATTQSVSELQWHLDQQVGNLYKKYEAQVNTKIKEFEAIQKQKELQESSRLQELEQRFSQYDNLIETLDKKWESKSNDRYIASIIQKNLLTNQNLGQFIVDKVLKLTEDTVQKKLDEHQKLLDERITNQFHQISTLTNQMRKYEKMIEDLQNMITVQKEFSLDFQKQQQKKLNVITHQNSLFKEVVQQQVHNIIEQTELNKTSVKQLKDQIEKQFEDASVGKINTNEQLMQILSMDQQKLRDFERKLDIVFKNENDIKLKIEQIQQDYSQQNQIALNQIITIDSEMRNINSTIHGLQDRVNQFTINQSSSPQPRQDKSERQEKKEKFRPLLISQKIAKPFSLLDQIGQIETLFRHVQLLFSHICKTYKNEKLQMQKQKIQSDISRDLSKEQVDVDSDHPQYVFQQYNQQKQEYQKEQTKPDTTQQQTINQQLKINIQPIYQGNEDYFSDTKLYFNTSLRPMLSIQGKQHALDVRPQIEISQLSAKVKQISNMFCDSELRQQLIDNAQSCRPNSGRKRLPKINSKSLNFTNDDQ